MPIRKAAWAQAAPSSSGPWKPQKARSFRIQSAMIHAKTAKARFSARPGAAENTWNPSATIASSAAVSVMTSMGSGSSVADLSTGRVLQGRQVGLDRDVQVGESDTRVALLRDLFPGGRLGLAGRDLLLQSREGAEGRAVAGASSRDHGGGDDRRGGALPRDQRGPARAGRGQRVLEATDVRPCAGGGGACPLG